ncbi:MAG: InlB B-repeat-containing protein, partial [Lachnospiraceae bacterium]|nr:InlB B-repeat-containing protein [Lachnospiraceae bacterium]
MKKRKKLGRKLLSWLLTLAMVVGLMPGMGLTAYAASTTVTWNPSDIVPEHPLDESFTKDGITITAATCDFQELTFGGGGTFTTTLGNFTKIEISADYAGDVSGTGWSNDGWQSATWTGDAASVSFSGDIWGGGMTCDGGNLTIVFTIATVPVTGVTLDKTDAQTIDVGGKVAFTATVAPDGATDKTVKWSVGGTNAGAVKLYTDADCTTEVGVDATETLTVYAKGISAGSATVTATSNADSTKSASCNVTVNAAAHTHNDITFTAWTSNDSLPTAAGSYYLANDVTLGSLWNVPEGTTNLCLNGHAIKSIGDHRMMEVGAGVTLSLYDEGAGVHKYTLNGDGLAVVDDNATGENVKTFEGGYLTGAYASNLTGACVLVKDGGIFNMHGGTMIGNYAAKYAFGGAVSVQASRFEMTGGKMIGNVSMHGAVDTRGGGDGFIMKGGEISYNTASNQGGAVCMGSGGIATISGGKITNNIALGNPDGSSESGGIVFRSGASALNISGNPIIKDNVGGDVYLWSGKKINVVGELTNEASIGITIKPATGTSGYASGVFTNSSDTSFNIVGAFFSNSQDYAVGKNADGQLFLGSPIVTLTYDGNGATGGNVPAETTGYASGSAITVPGNTNSLVKTGLVFDGWNTMADGSGTAYAADQAFTITANTTLYAQWKIVHVHDDISFTAWTDTNSMPTKAGNYFLANDVTISSTWNVPSGMTNLCLNGHGIIMSGTNRVITVSSGRTLNLYDCGTEAVHKFTVTNPSDGGAGLAKVNDGLENGYQTFTGGYITGGQGGQGGGVYIAGGTFNMHGGNIIGNHAQGSMYYDGGGVALSENTNSRFVMTGGAIQYNTSVGRGGGVGIQKKATAELSGDAKITYNSCNDWGGGISSFGALSISGNVKITNNKGWSALHPQQGSFNVSGAPVIFDNEVTANVLPEVMINVTGTLTEGAKLGVYWNNAKVFTNSTNTSFNDVSKFVSDNPNLSVMKNADEQLCLGTSYTVTFKVVNGSWDDETTADKTVTLNGYEGAELKLTENQIPAVGSKPGATYKAEGSWNVTPNVNTVITAATTYVYTYEEKDAPSEAVAPYVTSWMSESICVEAVSGQEYVIVLKGQTPDWTEAVTTTAEYHEFGNLTPATEYTIYTRVKETDSTFASEAKKTDVLTSLNGWETRGEPKTGETITIIPDPEDAQGLTWQWYHAEVNDQESVVKGEAIEGETSSSYVVKEGDVGKYLYYVISKGGKELENGYVGPVRITIHPTVSLEGWAYGENPNTPVVTGNTGNGSESYTYVEKGSEDPESETVPTMPGDYTVFAYVEESGDYAFGYAEAEFTITKATPTANDFNFTAPSDLDYDGHTKTATVTFNTQNGTLNGMGDVTVNYYSDANCTDQVESKNAGTYYVGITVAEGDNYNATTSVLHGDDWQFAIGKVSVTAPTIASKTYNGEVQTADVQTSNLYTVTTNAGGTNVGEYDVVLTLSDSTNYKWTESDEATKTLTFRITKAAAPTVTVPTPEVVTYDPTKTLADVALSDGWTWVTATTVPTVVNEGYAAALTVDDANYDYAEVEGYSAATHKVTRTVALTVNKADGTAATVNPANRTYDGTSKALASVTSEAVGGEMKYVLGGNGTTAPTEGWGSSIPTATDAGTYYVWYKVVGDENHNDAAPACITVTIGKKALTITADSAAKVYDTTALTKDSYTNTDLAAGDSIESVTITGSQTTAASSDNVPSGAVIKNGGTDVTANYQITYVNGTLTVTQATTNTVTVDITGWTYGESANAPTSGADFGANTVTYSYSDAQDGTYTATVPVNAGTWYVKASVAETADYVAGEATKSFTIAKREVVVSGIVAVDKNYDGTNTASLDFSKASFENLMEADAGKLSVTATGAFEDEKIGMDKKVNITGLTLTGEKAGNYVLAANGQQKEATADVSNVIQVTDVRFTGRIKNFTDLEADVTGITLDLAKSLCTAAELAAYGAGGTLELELEISKLGNLMTEDTVSLVQNAVRRDKNVGIDWASYYDISLYKVAGGVRTKVTDLSGQKLKITMKVPAENRSTPAEVRYFYVVRVHGGAADVLAETTGYDVIFESDKFSTYALCYADEWLTASSVS